MLAAMGYQQGKGLGKDQSGRAAPIDVKLKSDRLGLGGEEAKKRKQQRLQQQEAEAGGLHSTCVANLYTLACCLYSCAVERCAACGSLLSAISRSTDACCSPQAYEEAGAAGRGVQAGLWGQGCTQEG